MNKKKIVFICTFSNKKVRNQLKLSDFQLQNKINTLLGKSPVLYEDFAFGVSAYIEEFEKNKEFEYHVIAPHIGMKQSKQEFELSGILYHFFKIGHFYPIEVLYKRLNIYQRTNYRENRRTIRSIIDKIEPDLVVLCGAENAKYSISVLDINNKPIYVILQTLLNDPKRIAMGVGNSYRRQIELEVFRHAQYFCTSSDTAIDIITKQNPKAVFLPAIFPTYRPHINRSDIEYDFVFFSRNITIYKGIEDTLKAIAIVKRKYKSVLLNVIGGVTSDYLLKLKDLVEQLDIKDNVVFSGYYVDLEETYVNVTKARVALLPGITAELNSTIREAMLMGLPTICYETYVTRDINANGKNLLTAPMNDIENLSQQMLYTLDNPRETTLVAENGKKYAENNFSNEAIVRKLTDYWRQIVENKI